MKFLEDLAPFWWPLFIIFCVIVVVISFLVTKFITEYLRERRKNAKACEIAPWIVHGSSGATDSEVVQE